MLVLLSFSLVAICAAAPQDLERVVRAYNAGGGTETDEICTNTEMGCGDCRTISICVEGLKRMVIPCEEPNGYCNNGSCMPYADSTCPAKKSEFICTIGDGTFPDPQNCHLYHICLNNTAYDYKCEIARSVYSQETRSCVKMSAAHKCNTVICSRDGQKVPYPGDRSMYFICDKGVPVVINTCPKFSILNENTQVCEEFCSDEGPIPKLNDPKGFFECIWRIGSKYTMESRVCPQSENVESVFDPIKRECVLTDSD